MLASFNRELRFDNTSTAKKINIFLEKRKTVIPTCEDYGFPQTRLLQPISQHDLDISKSQTDEFSQYGL